MSAEIDTVGLKYPKINTIFKRDKGKLVYGDWSKPEFEYLANNIWIAQEKVDGTNIRIRVLEDKILFAGRTDRAEIPKHLLSALHATFDPIASTMCELLGDACLYGEGYGPKINGGGKYRDTPGFVLFDIRVGNWWLKQDAVLDIANQLNIDVVPVLGSGTLFDFLPQVREGFKSEWGDFEAEGMVLRPKIDLCTRVGSRIITKIKCRDFKNMIGG